MFDTFKCPLLIQGAFFFILKSNIMNTKIKVLKADYFAGSYHEADSEIELTPRQLACAERRGREFEVIKSFSPEGGPKVTSPKVDTPTTPPQDEKGTTPKGSSVKELKAALDDAGVEYAAKASKPDLQKLVDKLADDGM